MYLNLIFLYKLTLGGKCLPAQRGDETSEHSYDQERTGKALEGGQGTHIIDEREDSQRQRDPYQDDHVTDNEIVDSFDDFHCITSFVCSAAGAG